MNPAVNILQTLPGLDRRSESGAVLVIVLWILFGVVAITLYFAHAMVLEMRAADQRAAGMEAEQAIEGARRFVTALVTNVNSAGVLPNVQAYPCAAVPVGSAHYWLIGRSGDASAYTSADPSWGLVDEASKINLNTAPSNMLINLPRMTSDLVNNILAWRSTNTSSQTGGAQSSTYLSLSEPYQSKNSPFESVEELRLVYGMDWQILYGEDGNLNGILDPNENDGDTLPPDDDLDGKLEPGLMEYCTVYTQEAANATNGTARFNLSTLSQANRAQFLAALTTNGISDSRARELLAKSSGPWTNLLQFYYATGMTTTEFAKVETSLRGTTLRGLINVNTASEAVLNCIPAWTSGQASQVVAYRQANTNSLYANGVTMIWITQVLSKTDVLAAAPYLTGHTYQFTADIAALGHHGRGYRRTRFVFDTRQGTPVILHRQELGHLGWALGDAVRTDWVLNN